MKKRCALSRIPYCKLIACFLVFVICVVNSGCASFSVCQLPQRSIVSYTNRVEKGDLAIAADNFYTPEKSIAYFDIDLSGKYVVPIFFIVTNRSSNKIYTVDAASFRLTADNIGTELSPMSEDEIAKKVQRGAFWRTFGWCLIVPIISIPAVAIGSAVHTSNVNSKAVSDAKNKNLLNQAVGPNDTLRGVVFFNVVKYKVRKLINPFVKAAFISNENDNVEVSVSLR
jgi:hypothetical protein